MLDGEVCGQLLYSKSACIDGEAVDNGSIVVRDIPPEMVLIRHGEFAADVVVIGLGTHCENVED